MGHDARAFLGARSFGRSQIPGLHIHLSTARVQQSEGEHRDSNYLYTSNVSIRTHWITNASYQRSTTQASNMAITKIALFKAPTGGDSEEVVRTALHESQKSSEQGSVAGFQIQDRSVIQVTSENHGHEDADLLRQLRNSCAHPTETFDAELNRLALETKGPATSPLLEVVVNYFPASRVTPDFRKQIEAEFLEFDSICRSVAEGDGGLAYGWSVDELDHDEVKEDKTRPFFILRGWRSMEDFDNLTKLEKFGKDAIPILMVWKAPFKMVR